MTQSDVAARARGGLERVAYGKLGLVVMRYPRMSYRRPDPGGLFLPAVSVAAAAIPALAAIAPLLLLIRLRVALDLFPGISRYLFTAALPEFFARRVVKGCRR